MQQFPLDQKGFLSLVIILLTLLVISILYFAMFRPFQTRPVLEESVQQPLADRGIDSSTYQSLLNTTTSEIKRLEQLQLERAQDFDLYRTQGE